MWKITNADDTRSQSTATNWILPTEAKIQFDYKKILTVMLILRGFAFLLHYGGRLLGQWNLT